MDKGEQDIAAADSFLRSMDTQARTQTEELQELLKAAMHVGAAVRLSVSDKAAHAKAREAEDRMWERAKKWGAQLKRR